MNETKCYSKYVRVDFSDKTWREEDAPMIDLKHLVHYICWRLTNEPDKLGATKLNKMLWFIDTQAYLKLGMPISNAKYMKQTYGPVPVNINEIITQLCDAGIVSTSMGPFHYFLKARFSCLKEPESSVFSPEQLLIMNEVIDDISNNHTAASISELSHNRAWSIAADNEEIPIYAILAEPDEITDEDREWADRELERYLSKRKMVMAN